MSDRDGERERTDEYAGPPPAAPRERDAAAATDAYAPPPQSSSSYAPPPPTPAYGDAAAPPASSRGDGGLPVQRMVNRRDGDWVRTRVQPILPAQYYFSSTNPIVPRRRTARGAGT